MAGLLISGWCCLAAGLIVLTGWFLDIDAIKTLAPGAVTMKSNTAASFLLLGLAMISARRRPVLSRVILGMLGLVVLAISFQSVLGANWRIDEWLIRDDESGGGLPGRMATTTAFCFLLNVGAVWILTLRRPGELMLLIVGWLGSLNVAIAAYAGVVTVAAAARGLGSEAWADTADSATLLFLLVGVSMLQSIWSLRQLRASTAGFLAGILLLAGIAATSDANNRERVQVVDKAGQTYKLLGALNLLESAIGEQEKLLHQGIEQGHFPEALSGWSAEVKRRLADLQHVPESGADPEMLAALAKSVQRHDQIIGELAGMDQARFQQSVAELSRVAEAAAHETNIIAVALRRTALGQLSQYADLMETSAKRALLFVPASAFVTLLLVSSAFFLLQNETRLRQKALEHLRWSEERFRTMANSIPQLAWIADAHGQSLWYNRRWCEYTGLSPESISQLGWSSFVDPAQLPKIQQRWEASLRSGSAFQQEIALRNKDGHFRQFLTLALPLRDLNGRVLQWFGTNTDTEDYRRALEELKRKEFELRLSQQLGRTGTFVWDIVKDHAQWSPELEALYGLEPGTYAGTYAAWLALLHPEDRQRVDQLMKESLEAGVFFAEWRARWSDGSVHWLAGRGSVSRDEHGKPQVMIGANFEITETKEAEAKVRQLNLELEERVQQRTQQLQQTNRELEAFTYSISHDLRAPLRALDGFSRMLVEEYSKALDADGRRMLGILRTESQRMGQLIDDLLAFSRMGRMSLQPTWVNMNDLAHSAIQEILQRFPGRQIRFEISSLPRIRGAHSMLRQVWINLLDNAAKFTRERGLAEITIGGKIEQDEAVYWVKDNGIGFDMRFASKLFGVFQRLHTGEEFGGTGVGLALVRRIIERHNGRVWAEGEPDHGATFYFTLPNTSESTLCEGEA